MNTEAEVRAAQAQVRETLIQSGITFAKRLRELRAGGLNYMVGCSTSGGLALIFVKGTKDVKPHLRFGSPASPQIARVSTEEAVSWNKQHPDHPIERVPVQHMLERECSRIFLLLLELDGSIKRTEV